MASGIMKSAAAIPTDRVSLATPAGRGAVAMIVVSGPRAVGWVGELLRPLGALALVERPPRTPVFGRWPFESGAVEEVVVCRTNDARAEVHCHGGPVAAAAIIATLAARGAAVTPWQDMVLDEERDSVAGAARRALAECRTERTALVLLDQLSGAWTRELDRLARLADAAEWQGLASRCEALLCLAPVGARLAGAWRVALAGRPNAGKSSLANALAGYERAIVSPAPGTTRDALAVELALEGWPVELVDTAGLRTSDERIEAAGVRRALETHAAADLVLIVADLSAPWTDAEERLAATHARSLIVHAKSDLAPSPGARPSGIEVSVRSGRGLAELTARIVERLVPCVPQSGEAVPFLPWQSEGLRELGSASEAADTTAVVRILAALRR